MVDSSLKSETSAISRILYTTFKYWKSSVPGLISHGGFVGDEYYFRDCLCCCSFSHEFCGICTVRGVKMSITAYMFQRWSFFDRQRWTVVFILLASFHIINTLVYVHWLAKLCEVIAPCQDISSMHSPWTPSSAWILLLSAISWYSVILCSYIVHLSLFPPEE